ncbi:hypothetical protein MRX96_032387 [Rhipicephalus microplus]
MAQSGRRGEEILVASVHSWAVLTQSDGRLLIEDLESRVRYRNIPCPRTTLLCLENTHNFCGGTMLSIDYVEQAAHFARSHNIPLHIDGARIMNAAAYLGLRSKDLLKGCDSVMMCISKGLSGPTGSLVAGSKDFIYK